MTAFSTKSLAIAAALGAVAAPALAQVPPTPWELKSDMGYAYDRDGKTYSYKMGTSNAGELLRSLVGSEMCIRDSGMSGSICESAAAHHVLPSSL